MKKILTIISFIVTSCGCGCEDEILQLESKNNELQSDIQSLYDEIEGLKSEIDDIESSISYLRDDIDDISYSSYSYPSYSKSSHSGSSSSGYDPEKAIRSITKYLEEKRKEQEIQKASTHKN